MLYDQKKMAIISWVLSVLFLGGAIFMFEGQFTKKLFFDCLLGIIWAFTGFRYWRNYKKEANE